MTRPALPNWPRRMRAPLAAAYCDQPEGPVILSYRDSAQDDEGRVIGWWLVYGVRPNLPYGAAWAPMLSLSGTVIGHIVKLLGPIEDPAT